MSQTPQDHKPEELSEEELDAQSAEQLPDREAMSIINPNAGGIVTPEPPLPVVE
jgi:hypothetical protein